MTALEFPTIVKTPGGAFSLEVFKCASPSEMKAIGERLFRRCPALVVQAFINSDFDWRIGVCNARAIYAVKYHYPVGSWKIAVHDPAGRVTFGAVEPVALDRLPTGVRDAALNAAASIGSGLYGVDVKETPDGVYVLEVNDNPDIDHKSEASIDPEVVYGTIMHTLDSRVRNNAGWSRDGGAL
jgi:glutathione synthase/RimK-type ligase-like ATP-grasp enzyme